VSRRRSRIIAIQALVVGALALIIVLTVLRPESDEPLFGVTTPEENTERVDVRQGDDRDRGEPAPREPRDDDRGPDDTRGQGTGGAEAIAMLRPWAGGYVGGGGTAAVPSAAGGARPAAPNDSKPTGDQYSDSLARLAAKLH
jgi:hypothetical protein